jgi:Animal haem peroxidase
LALRARPVVARDHCLAPARVVDAPIYGGQYRKLFPELPALDAEEAVLHALGSPGGVCDGAPLAAAGDDDSHVAAGWPFFGQFVAHDITADRSPLTHRADTALLRNFRTPRANLECLYGGGPVGSPYLFQREDPAKFLIGAGGRDLIRNVEGIALIGDPRNDVHLFMSQMHLAFLHAHNLLVDRLRDDDVPESDVFEEARRALTWHYQWIMLSDFLPSLIGDELTRELLDEGPQFYPGDDGQPYIPLEFADAAYRYGHSQIRHRYRLNADGPELPMFPDLMGFGPVPEERVVDWSYLFDVAGRPPAQRAKRIDGRLPASLINLPVQITGEVDDDAYHSLAARDLQRGQAVGLPSGEAVARRLGLTPLGPDEIGLGSSGWHDETPLWLYLLREADVVGDGDRLGPVGGRLVGEVLVGIVDADAESYRSVDRDWRPTLPAGEPGRYGIADLLLATEMEAVRG